MTSVTTLLALFSIFFFGGAVLADFALAMNLGCCDWDLLFSCSSGNAHMV